MRKEQSWKKESNTTPHSSNYWLKNKYCMFCLLVPVTVSLTPWTKCYFPTVMLRKDFQLRNYVKQDTRTEMLHEWPFLLESSSRRTWVKNSLANWKQINFRSYIKFCLMEMKWVYREWLQLKGSYPNSSQRFNYMNATWPSFCFGIAWRSFITSWIACFHCSCTSPSLIKDRYVCIRTERHSRSRTTHSQFYHWQLKHTIQAAIQRWSQKKCFKMLFQNPFQSCELKMCGLASARCVAECKVNDIFDELEHLLLVPLISIKIQPDQPNAVS